MIDDSETSPKYLRISLAAAMTLGLRPGTFYRGARLHCLNLLLTYPEGCYANCAYCGLRRERKMTKAGRQSFIRVEWPVFPLQEIISRIKSHVNPFERACVSMVMHPQAFGDTITVVRNIVEETGLAVSVLANPSTMENGMMEDLADAGADMASVAVDAATDGLFERHRGAGVSGPHRWDRYWRSLDEAALVFGRNRSGCHLIAGLGETEQQMVEAIGKVRSLGGRTHLFSFYPEEGSLLADAKPCPASHFRRVQLARFLIDYDIAGARRMEFDEHGRIISYGVNGGALEELVASGQPFMTSGCSGKSMPCACNRPFGDGPPTDIRSYPFELADTDVRQVRKELVTYQEVASGIDLKS